MGRVRIALLSADVAQLSPLLAAVSAPSLDDANLATDHRHNHRCSFELCLAPSVQTSQLVENAIHRFALPVFDSTNNNQRDEVEFEVSDPKRRSCYVLALRQFTTTTTTTAPGATLPSADAAAADEASAAGTNSGSRFLGFAFMHFHNIQRTNAPHREKMYFHPATEAVTQTAGEQEPDAASSFLSCLRNFTALVEVETLDFCAADYQRHLLNNSHRVVGPTLAMQLVKERLRKGLAKPDGHAVVATATSTATTTTATTATAVAVASPEVATPHDAVGTSSGFCTSGYHNYNYYVISVESCSPRCLSGDRKKMFFDPRDVGINGFFVGQEGEAKERPSMTALNDILTITVPWAELYSLNTATTATATSQQLQQQRLSYTKFEVSLLLRIDLSSRTGEAELLTCAQKIDEHEGLSALSSSSCSSHAATTETAVSANKKGSCGCGRSSCTCICCSCHSTFSLYDVLCIPHYHHQQQHRHHNRTGAVQEEKAEVAAATTTTTTGTQPPLRLIQTGHPIIAHRWLPDEIVEHVILPFLVDPRLVISHEASFTITKRDVRGRVDMASFDQCNTGRVASRARFLPDCAGLMYTNRGLYQLASRLLRETHYAAEIPRGITQVGVSADVLRISGGGTLFEFKENLLVDGVDPWCKWYCVTVMPVEISYRFQSPVLVTGYAFKTANDMPGRDPVNWQVFADDEDNTDKSNNMNRFNNSSSGRVIDKIDSAPSIMSDTSRFKWHVFLLPEPVRVGAVIRFLIASVRHVGMRHIQLAQVAVLGQRL